MSLRIIKIDNYAGNTELNIDLTTFFAKIQFQQREIPASKLIALNLIGNSVGIEFLYCCRVPTAHLTAQNKMYFNHKHNVENANLDLN